MLLAANATNEILAAAEAARAQALISALPDMVIDGTSTTRMEQLHNQMRQGEAYVSAQREHLHAAQAQLDTITAQLGDIRAQVELAEAQLRSVMDAKEEAVASAGLAFALMLQSRGLALPPPGVCDSLVRCNVCFSVTLQALRCAGAADGTCFECLPHLLANVDQPKCPAGCCAWSPDVIRFGLSVLQPDTRGDSMRRLLKLEARDLVEAARHDERVSAERALRELGDVNELARCACPSLFCPGCGLPATVTDEGTCLTGHSECGLDFCTCCFEYGSRSSDSKAVHDHISMCKARLVPGGFFAEPFVAEQHAVACAFAIARAIQARPALRAALENLPTTLEGASHETVLSLHDMGLRITDDGVPDPVLTGAAAGALPRLRANLGQQLAGLPPISLCLLNESFAPAVTAQWVDKTEEQMREVLVREALCAAPSPHLAYHFSRLNSYALGVMEDDTDENEFVLVLYTAHVRALKRALQQHPTSAFLLDIQDEVTCVMDDFEAQADTWEPTFIHWTARLEAAQEHQHLRAFCTEARAELASAREDFEELRGRAPSQAAADALNRAIGTLKRDSTDVDAAAYWLDALL